jgi:hypothetical protein
MIMLPPGEISFPSTVKFSLGDDIIAAAIGASDEKTAAERAGEIGEDRFDGNLVANDSIASSAK